MAFDIRQLVPEASRPDTATRAAVATAVEAALHARGGAYVIPPPPPDFSGRNPPSMLPFRSCVNAAASLGTPAGTPRAAGSTGSRSPNPDTPPASSMSRGCVTMSMPRLVGRGRSFGHGPDIGEWLAAPSAGNCRAGPVRRRVLPHSRPPCLTADLNVRFP